MNFQDGDIALAWEDILGSEKYHLMLVDIQDNYPNKKSLTVSYKDIDSYSTDLGLFILESPDKAIEVGEQTIRNMLPATW